MKTRLLILGGTTEARRLADTIKHRAALDITISLAGRTQDPAPLPVPTRVGGFGGVEGLAEYLRSENIGMMIDATHPYAAIMSASAAEAARITGVPLLALRRAGWKPQEGDRWTMVPDMAAAVTALGAAPQRVFLALGRKELAPFEAAPQHAYVVRSVDPVEPPLNVPDAQYILARGPFDEDDDRILMMQNRITAIVCKNSGGKATSGKLAAARTLGVPVIMVDRPPVPDVKSVHKVNGAVAWINQLLRAPVERGE